MKLVNWTYICEWRRFTSTCVIQDASSGQLMAVFIIIDLWSDVEVTGGSWKKFSVKTSLEFWWSQNCRPRQHLDSTKHTFNNNDVIILDKVWGSEAWKRQFMPPRNKGGGLRHNLAGAYTVITKIPKAFWLRTFFNFRLWPKHPVIGQLL